MTDETQVENATLESYYVDFIDFKNIDKSLYDNDTKLTKYFWGPNPIILSKLESLLKKLNISTNIIDIGCGTGYSVFKHSTHILTFDETKITNKIKIKLDLDFDKFPYNDNYFKFGYCRHTLEDIQNPQNAFSEITRVCSMGYIETPSPLAEITTGISAGPGMGYIHHRYIVWSDLKTNTLYFLPKYPILECMTFDTNGINKIKYLLSNYPVFWNNYYIWDSKNPPNIFVYRNEVNFNIINDYSSLINKAIYSYIEYTEHFISNYINIL
jgi:hypothetical protein